MFHVVESGQQCPVFNEVKGDKNQVFTGFSGRCYGSCELAKAVSEESLERKVQWDTGGNVKGPEEKAGNTILEGKGEHGLKGWPFKG